MNERIKFYTDEHIDLAVVFGLRLRGVDVVSAQEAMFLNTDDTIHFEFAQLQQRTVITQDSDFLRFHADGQRHCGIVYAPQHTSIGIMIRGIMLIYDILNASDMNNHVEFL